MAVDEEKARKKARSASTADSSGDKTAYCAASKGRTKIENALTGLSPVLMGPGDVGIKASRLA